jgi:hypothetical protein
MKLQARIIIANAEQSALNLHWGGRMVFGIGEGSLDITLDKQVYSPGETITGKVKLNLNGPKQAKSLIVEFHGEIVKEVFVRGSHGRTNTSEQTIEICTTQQQLATEKTFQNGEEYSFSLQISPQALNSPEMQPPKAPDMSQYGVAGQLIGALGAMNMRVPQIISGPTFFVSAKLDLPMAMDMNKKIMVQILPGQAQPQQPGAPQQAPAQQQAAPSAPPWVKSTGSPSNPAPNPNQPPWVK